ncbi:ribosome silencing factor [Neptunomonas japonica]|uniref:Ribosomal silencing factor RsfS n=1 Tax=Neptunomonas japonica JAMM 1380 TaxID=1441457 RepID=A0A7R6P731_9GAMM|nr:ribosome silencing factor [Neptunomonas japonica]BBB28459.1 ribosome-associated protein [Neptunomonas japonica JAMM 1380]
MQTEQLIGLVRNALEDVKGRDIEVIDVRGKSSITDFMMIATGTSKRHVVSLAQSVSDKVKEAGVEPMGSEGQTDGDWVLVDLGELVVHVMMPDARSYYDLERLWQFDPLKDEESSEANVSGLS